MENQRDTAVPDIEERTDSAEKSQDSAAKETSEGQSQENPETHHPETAQKAQPTEQPQPTEPLQPIEPSQPVESSQPVEPPQPPQPVKTSQSLPEENEPPPVPIPALEEIRQAIADLQQSFDDKIAQDKHKNALFDQMHRELVQYQNGVADKNTETMAMDIIQLIDSTRNHIRVYEEKEGTQENYDRLLRLVKGLVEDLQDVLYRQSIEAYRVAGEEVDVRRQKIIQTLETEDPAQDNFIAVRVADGYEKGDKVLRPERIKIYKYHKKSPDADDK